MNTLSLSKDEQVINIFLENKQNNKLYLQDKKLFTKHKSSPFNNAVEAQP